MPIRLCSTPGCPERAHYRGRCVVHARSANTRSTFAHVYKSKRWRILRRAVIARNPMCQACGERASQIGDHIVPMPNGAAFDPENIQALCIQCHGVKTAREQHEASR